MNHTASTTALLVVHLQNDIVSEGTAFGSLFHAQATQRDVLASCNQAMQDVREAGGLVVALRIAFEPDYSNLAQTIPLLQMVVQAGCLKEGSIGAQLVDEIQISDADLILTHQRPGPFTNSDLQQILQERGITQVAVCGVATNASVEGAVRQAADLGYATTVLSDACSAADEASHEASLASMGLFAAISTVEDFRASLAK